MHVPEFSVLAHPLYNLCKKRNKWEWGPEHKYSLQALKEAVTLHASLASRRPEGELWLHIGVLEGGPHWSLWQKKSLEAEGKPLRFWS